VLAGALDGALKGALDGAFKAPPKTHYEYAALESVEKDALAKQFNPPAGDNAGLYIYHHHYAIKDLGQREKGLWIDDKYIGALPDDVYFYYYELPTGEHTIILENYDPVKLIKLKITAEKGKLYFVKQDLGWNIDLGEVDSETGKAYIGNNEQRLAAIMTDSYKQDALAKQFNPAENAGLYIYTTHLYKSIISDILVDDYCVGRSYRGNYLYYELPEGEHVITTESSQGSSDKLEIVVQKGELYFIQQNLQDLKLNIIESEKGKAEIYKRMLTVYGCEADWVNEYERKCAR
jgi:hypothetical protein